VKYLGNPQWQFSKIRILNSCGHLTEHLVGEIQEKSKLLWPTLFPFALAL
jgi:hypothetical protein